MAYPNSWFNDPMQFGGFGTTAYNQMGSISSPQPASFGSAVPTQASAFTTQATQPTSGFDSGFWFGNKQQLGAIPVGLGVAQAGLGAWLGMEQLDLAKDQLAFQKDAFNKNYQNQLALTNRALYDRARSRASYEGQDFNQSFEEWEKSKGLGR